MSQDVTLKETEPQLRDNQRGFLAAYEQSGTIRGAAAASGVSRQSHFRWRRDDPGYLAAFKESHAIACDGLEDEARRRAVEGLRRVKFGRNGKPLIDPETGEPYTEHVYSDVLLIFLLKGAMPAKYADRSKIEVKPARTQEDLERFKRQHGYREGESLADCLQRLSNAIPGDDWEPVALLTDTDTANGDPQ